VSFKTKSVLRTDKIRRHDRGGFYHMMQYNYRMKRRYVFNHADDYTESYEHAIFTKDRLGAEPVQARMHLIQLLADAYNVTVVVWHQVVFAFEVCQIAGSSALSTARTQEQIHLLCVESDSMVHYLALTQDENRGIPQMRYQAHYAYLLNPTDPAQYPPGLTRPTFQDFDDWYRVLRRGFLPTNHLNATTFNNLPGPQSDALLPDIDWTPGIWRGPKWPRAYFTGDWQDPCVP
jgi:hypothetical protein